MTRENRIRENLTKLLDPQFLEIENESHHHSGSRQESHFKVLVVSSAFEGKSRIDRQRMVNEILAEELKTGLHALTQRALTPAEWEKQKTEFAFESPACSSKKKS